MTTPHLDLRDTIAGLRAVVERTREPDNLRSLGDRGIVDLMDAAATVTRAAEALFVEATSIALERSETGVVADRLTTRFGCRSPRELVQRVTRLSGARSNEIVRAARAAEPMTSPLGDALLPARYPALREALLDGAVGADAVAGVATVLDRAATSPEHRLAADTELAASCGRASPRLRVPRGGIRAAGGGP